MGLKFHNVVLRSITQVLGHTGSIDYFPRIEEILGVKSSFHFPECLVDTVPNSRSLWWLTSQTRRRFSTHRAAKFDDQEQTSSLMRLIFSTSEDCFRLIKDECEYSLQRHGCNIRHRIITGQ